VKQPATWMVLFNVLRKETAVSCTFTWSICTNSRLMAFIILLSLHPTYKHPTYLISIANKHTDGNATCSLAALLTRHHRHPLLAQSEQKGLDFSGNAASYELMHTLTLPLFLKNWDWKNTLAINAYIYIHTHTYTVTPGHTQFNK
jgi:hypothetical protein